MSRAVAEPKIVAVIVLAPMMSELIICESMIFFLVLKLK
jgi:hypothetical protein